MTRGWLIIRVDGQLFVRRHPLRDPTWPTIEALLRQHGYERGGDLEATAYTSPRRDGHGRAGSQVTRWRVRKAPS